MQEKDPILIVAVPSSRADVEQEDPSNATPQDMKLNQLNSTLKVVLESNESQSQAKISERELELLELERLETEIDDLLIYTKAVKWPTIDESISESRFIIRVLQLVFALGSFRDIDISRILIYRIYSNFLFLHVKYPRVVWNPILLFYLHYIHGTCLSKTDLVCFYIRNVSLHISWVSRRSSAQALSCI
jgi:hypothetical protein